MEQAVEKILESYLSYKESYNQLRTLSTFFSTSIIKIMRDRNCLTVNTRVPFGIHTKFLLEGKIAMLDNLVISLDKFSSEYIQLRYYEQQSREFIIQYFKLGSVSTYKRMRHRVLAKCMDWLEKQYELEVFFPEIYQLFHQQTQYAQVIPSEEE
ncbi:hypothetical protein LLG10_07005 [bacterium]|nr:hypothetical protein [bacterium]